MTQITSSRPCASHETEAEHLVGTIVATIPRCPVKYSSRNIRAAMNAPCHCDRNPWGATAASFTALPTPPSAAAILTGTTDSQVALNNRGDNGSLHSFA